MLVMFKVSTSRTSSASLRLFSRTWSTRSSKVPAPLLALLLFVTRSSKSQRKKKSKVRLQTIRSRLYQNDFSNGRFILQHLSRPKQLFWWIFQEFCIIFFAFSMFTVLSTEREERQKKCGNGAKFIQISPIFLSIPFWVSHKNPQISEIDRSLLQFSRIVIF